MTEVDKLIDQASATKAYPAKPPRTKNEPRQPKQKSEKIKETAIAVISDALAHVKDRQDKIIQKTDQSKVPVAAVHEAFQQFETAVGGRESLLKILMNCGEQSKGYGMIQKLLQDPDFLIYARTQDDKDNVRYSLSAICNRHRIPFNAIIEAFRDAKTAEIALQSLQELAPHTPKVVEQIVADAQNSFQMCPVCEGSARIWRISEIGEWALDPETGEHLTQICHNCRGKGKVFKEHDTQDRKTFLQMVGLLEANRGPLVQVNNNSNTAIFKGEFLPGDGSFEKIIKAVDNIGRVKATVEDIIDIPNTQYESEEDECTAQE